MICVRHAQWDSYDSLRNEGTEWITMWSQGQGEKTEEKNMDKRKNNLKEWAHIKEERLWENRGKWRRFAIR